MQKFCKEVVTWKALRHPNVLPLIGVTMDGIHFAMVSEWMENGTINQFVEKNPDADRLGLVCSPFKIRSVFVGDWTISPAGRCCHGSDIHS